MRHGDLSAATPRRLLVNLDYVALPPNAAVRRRWRRRDVASGYTPLPGTIGGLLRVSARHGLLVEMFAVGVDQDVLDAVMARLDAGQAHPFTHAQRHDTLADLVATLPYRPEVLGVVDEPSRALRYGHWYMSTDGL